MKVETYCGGPVETNGYLISHEGASLLIDAPEGIMDWLIHLGVGRTIQLKGLLLTHGHWDHIAEAAKIQESFKTPVLIHRDSAPLLENSSIQAAFNPFFELRACRPDRVLEKEAFLELAYFKFDLILCPGHCPGSLCFYFSEEKKLFGGDVLFAGSVGRWDLPGGSQQQLLSAISEKILTLPDEVQVYPGHGPSTTVGQERQTNPYLSQNSRGKR